MAWGRLICWPSQHIPGCDSGLVLFILRNQEKDSLYKVKDLERLSDSLSSSVLLNKNWMEDSAIKDIKQQVQTVIDKTSSEHIIKKYGKLIASLYNI